MTITEDLDTFLADFGVSVAWGAVSGTGILDMPDQVIGGGLSLSTDYTLTCKFATFGGAEFGDSITVDGAAYTVQEVKKIDDGKFCRITLTKT